MDFGAEAGGHTQTYELRPRRSGEIIDLAIRLLKGTFRSTMVFMAPVVGLASIPFAFGTIRTIQYWTDDASETNGSLSGAAYLLLIIAIGFAQLVTMVVMFGQHVGVPTPLRKAVGISVRKALWVVLYFFVSMICFYALSIPLTVISLMMTGMFAFAGPVGAGLGFVVGLCGTTVISMGFVSRFHLGVIALLVENRGPIDALKRGWTLSKRRWLLFGGIHTALVMFSYLILFLFLWLSIYVFGSLGSSMIIAIAVLAVFCVMIWSLLYCAIGVAMFVDCRVRRDGLDLAMRVGEFSQRMVVSTAR